MESYDGPEGKKVAWLLVCATQREVLKKLNRLQQEAFTEAVCYLGLYSNLNRTEQQYKDAVDIIQDEWQDVMKKVHHQNPVQSGTDRQDWWEQKGREAAALLIKELLDE